MKKVLLGFGLLFSVLSFNLGAAEPAGPGGLAQKFFSAVKDGDETKVFDIIEAMDAAARIVFVANERYQGVAGDRYNGYTAVQIAVSLGNIPMLRLIYSFISFYDGREELLLTVFFQLPFGQEI